MKKFNSLEKFFLKKLITEFEKNSKPLFLSKFFEENVLVNRGIFIHENGLITIQYNEEKDPEAPNEILNFISLFEYLENNGLIISTINEFSQIDNNYISHNMYIEKGQKTLFPVKSNLKNFIPPTKALTFPKGYYEKVKLIYMSDLFVTSELIDLVNNNFITIEDRAYKISKTQILISFFALSIAFITLLFSFYIFYDSKIKTEKANKSINKETLRSKVIKTDVKSNTLNENNIKRKY